MATIQMSKPFGIIRAERARYEYYNAELVAEFDTQDEMEKACEQYDDDMAVIHLSAYRDDESGLAVNGDTGEYHDYFDYR